MNQQFNHTITKGDDHVYIDMAFTNFESVSTAPPAINFTQNFASDVLVSPQNYYLAIASWSLETYTLPCITPIIQLSPNTDCNKTIYSITLSYTYSGTTYDYQQYIIFVPQNKSSPIPPAPMNSANGFQDNSSLYYNIYNKQNWIKMINTAFTSAFNGLNTLIIGAGGTLPSTYPPNMIFDIISNLATIQADVAGYNTNSLSPYISIYFNPAMMGLFSSFPSIIEDYNTLSNGKNFQILTNINGDANYIAYPPYNPISGLYFIQCSQSTNTSDTAWNSVLSIQFISNNLPVSPVVISSPTLYNNGVKFQQYSDASNLFANVITDFVSDGSYVGKLVYVPSVYRYIDLNNSQDINKINISIRYTDRLNYSYPLLLASGMSATIKLMFVKKTLLLQDK